MNIPNRLSLSRIIIAPLMMFFYFATFIPGARFVAAGLFVIGAITDFVDGYIARKYNLITDLGKFLDPIGDKLLVTFALILVTTDGTIPLPYGAIVLAIIVGRDLVVDMLRQVAGANGTVIAADIFGKYKTTTRDVALAILLVYSGLLALGTSTQTALDIIMWVGYGFLILAVLLTIISLINYLVKNRAVFSKDNGKKESEKSHS